MNSRSTVLSTLFAAVGLVSGCTDPLGIASAGLAVDIPRADAGPDAPILPPTPPSPVSCPPGTTPVPGGERCLWSTPTVGAVTVTHIGPVRSGPPHARGWEWGWYECEGVATCTLGLTSTLPAACSHQVVGCPTPPPYTVPVSGIGHFLGATLGTSMHQPETDCRIALRQVADAACGSLVGEGIVTEGLCCEGGGAAELPSEGAEPASEPQK
jgi:hypothetical protein